MLFRSVVEYRPVAEVVEVPAEYELAMEAALGNRLQMLLSSDADAAVSGVDYLKEQKNGRSSFFAGAESNAVSSSETQQSELKGESGVQAMLSDVVRVPEGHERQVAQIIKDIVIVDSIRTALALRPNYSGKTFVTVDGDTLSEDGAGEWIYYAGLASHQKQTQASMTREVALREMAVLFGGEVAQTLVTKGARHDAGKSNDMERATKMAYVAILNWGLSEAWGPSAVHRDVIEKVLDHFKAGLTSQRRKLLDREVDRMLKEARELARLALLTNIDNALIPMGQTLAEKGTLNKDDLNQFYKDHSVVKEGDAGFGGFLKTHTGTALKARMAHRNKRFGRDGEFLDSIPQPSSIANIVKLTQAKKQKQVDSVEISNDIPFAKSLEGYHSLKPEKPRSLTHD